MGASLMWLFLHRAKRDTSYLTHLPCGKASDDRFFLPHWRAEMPSSPTAPLHDSLKKCEDALFKKSRRMTLFLFLRGVGDDELAADFHKLCRALLFELSIIRAGQFLQIFL